MMTDVRETNHPGVCVVLLVRVRCGAGLVSRGGPLVSLTKKDVCGVLVRNKKKLWARGRMREVGRVGGDDGKGGRGKQSVRWGERREAGTRGRAETGGAPRAVCCFGGALFF